MSAIMSNNGDARLAASLSAGDLTLQLKAGHGARFAAIPAGSWTPLTIVDSAGNFEIVRATGKSGDTFTILRAQEGTTARAFAVDAVVQNRPTAAVYGDLYSRLDSVDSAANAALPKGGGTMTGYIVLNGNATGNLHPVTKQQMDAAVGGITAIPSGAVAAFAMNTAPAGWLKANGAAVSRTTYAALFAAIGTTFGAGDGSTTFNLPDLRGEFVRGWDDARGIDTGRAFGSAQVGQNASHTHTASTDSQGLHSHTTHGHNANSYANNSTAGGGSEKAGGGSTSSDGAHTHTVTVNASGGTEARPRNIALLHCIKF